MTSTDQFALTYTGERYHPELLDEIRQEHMHRYLWALGMVGGRDVIDLACGEGFGSAMLAGVARQVIGIDISEKAVAHATSRYQAPNLSFRCANAVSLPLPDHSVDVVVSFETIEHLSDQTGMIAEIRRVLRHDGFLVMSSPNTEVYAQRQGHINEFHERELTGPEFENLLRGQFPHLRVFGQRLSVASSILSCRDDADGMASVFRDGSSVERSAREIPETMYFVAVAAADESFLPALQASFLVSASYDVYWKMRDEAVRIRAETELQAEEAQRLRAEKDRLAEESGVVWAEKDRLAEEAQRLRAERDRLIEESGILWAEKDRLAEESRCLRAERDRLAEGAGYLKGENEKLAAENLSQQGLLTLAAEYLVPGWRKKLKPSPFFDPNYYRANNPDVAKSRIDPLLHYLRFGRLEGRLPKAPADAEDKGAQASQLQQNSEK